MAIPLLAPLIGGALRLGGRIVKGIRDRRISKGKSGSIFSGTKRFFGRIFNRKNKSQRMQAAANRTFVKNVKKQARKDNRFKRQFESDFKKRGGDLAAFNNLNQTPAMPVIKIPPTIDLTNTVKGFAKRLFRRPQEFQLPPDVKESQGLNTATASATGNNNMLLGGLALLAIIVLFSSKK